MQQHRRGGQEHSAGVQPEQRRQQRRQRLFRWVLLEHCRNVVLHHAWYLNLDANCPVTEAGDWFIVGGVGLFER